MQYWSDILGHKRVLSVLSRAVDGDRLHHAYLFSGPFGVGKFAVARALAAVLNCEERPSKSFRPSCNRCSTCRRLATRQHPDVLYVEPKGKFIKIDQIRELQKASISAPYEGGYRVVLIDEAHLMTEEAANALLKTLEEPPQRMILLLITDQPQRLLDTIISRCQQVRFGALELDEVTNALEAIFSRRAPFDTEETDALELPAKEEIDPALFEVAAGYSEGSLGRALEMLSSGMLEARRPLITQALSVDPRSPVAWLDAGAALGDSSAKLQERLDVLTVFFRDLMLYKRTGTERLVNSDLVDLVEKTAPQFSLEAILSVLEALMHARARLQGNVSAQLLAEDLVYRLNSPELRRA